MENVNTFGGIAFGLVIGFLSWYAVFPRSGKFLVSWRTISAFLGVVGGGVVTALFPANSEAFGGYSIGLCLGFFYSPIWNFFSEQFKKSQPSDFTRELNAINTNWSSISNVIAHKINRYGIVDITSLEELPYSYDGKTSIMRRFAELFIEQGVEIRKEGNNFQLVLKFTRQAGDPPIKYIGTIRTAFKYGFDDYDESWPIESATGEFLGECGVAISELGVIDKSSPKKVTTFEVWLFDKNDIRTLAKYIISEYAYLHSDITSKVVEKDCLPILAKERDTVVLDTVSLTIRVEIKNLEYVNDKKAVNNLFKTVQLEITMWSKDIKLN